MVYVAQRRRSLFLYPFTIMLLGILLICVAMPVAAQTYFRTDTGIPYIPVLSTAPTPTSAGAVYINSADKKMYWYDGTQWLPKQYIKAPDGTSVSNITSSTGRVWMDRNLGATQAATGSTDYLAYGSFFQWCRAADGHQLITWTNGTTGTPVNGTTTTLSTSTTAPNSLFIISTNSPNDWLSTQQSDGSLWWNGTAVGANNSCPTGYHVPTYAEWNAEYSAGITNAATAFSRLKLPAAGYRNRSDGTLSLTGSYGYYWSSTVTGTNAYYLNFYSGGAGIYNNVRRSNGFSVRCIKDLDTPLAQNVSVSGTAALGSTLTGNYTYQASQAGGLAEGTSMYKWYYANDALGNGKTPVTGANGITYTLASPVSGGNYIAFGVTAVSTDGRMSTEMLSNWRLVQVVVDLLSPSGRVWMDRNMGATQVATGSTDAASYGSFYQWCRGTDGHELNTSVNYNGPVASSATSAGNAWYGKFVYNNTSPNDWLSVQLSDGSLWWNGSATGTNNPCPQGYHVPTYAEWNAEYTAGITNSSTAYNQLKLPLPGLRSYVDGSFTGAGVSGVYWSSTQVAPNGAYQPFFNSTTSAIGTGVRSYGFSVRCIKTLTTPLAQNVSVSGTAALGSTLTGTYTYLSSQTGASPEGTSIYKWYYATDASGTGQTTIIGATGKTYSLAAPVSGGNYIAFGVTPVATNGAMGLEVLSAWQPVLYYASDGTLVNPLISSTGRVWMDRNLGATQAATSSTDYLSYGSLYQWCRAADGHQLITWTNGTTGTPVNGTTTTLSTSTTAPNSLFITNSNSPYDWLSTQQSDGSLWWSGTAAGANNPCPTNYHVPTYAEWNDEVTAGISNTATAYGLLKLPMAGGRHFSIGSLNSAGSYGHYWSSTVTGTNAYYMYFYSGTAYVNVNYRAFAFSVRCIKNLDTPLAQNVSVSGAAELGSTVTGTYTYLPSPTGASPEGTSIYRWYYATDASGTAKTAISGATGISYTLASPVAGGNYIAFGVRAVSTNGSVGPEVLSGWQPAVTSSPDGTAIFELTSSTGRVWMDRNLGATQAATGSTDYLAYGSLYQWCRAADGHQKITWTSGTTGSPVNGTTATLSASTTAPNSLFITNSNSPYDWLSTQQSDGNLWWSGTAAGTNNPCPTGYHVPTYTEWNAEMTAGITNPATAYSRLKLPVLGYRSRINGAFSFTGSRGIYWSSTVNGTNAYSLYFYSGAVVMSVDERAYGFSVRCIKN